VVSTAFRIAISNEAAIPVKIPKPTTKAQKRQL
jgi:hypothetical protein